MSRSERRSLLLIWALTLPACSAEESPPPFRSGATDDGGATGGATARGDPPASSGGASACVPALARCDAEAPCCAGSVCVERPGDAPRCIETCSAPTDCGSLCCAKDAATGLSLCAAASECPPLACSGPRGPCEQPGPSCCAGLTCVFSRAPEYAGCRKPCGDASECDTGCCVPYANAAASFCADAAACACSTKDAPCGGVRRCCAGLACTTFDASGTFACKPLCERNADCDSGCCLSVSGTAEAACLPRQWCDG